MRPTACQNKTAAEGNREPGCNMGLRGVVNEAWPARRNLRASLIDLPVRDRETGDVTVVVETPKGSHNKYKYDRRCRALRLGAVLAEGLAFPYDFGFIPSTQGEDGDPLDVLLFLDHGVPPGSVVTARLIGVLEVRQREGRGKWKRNDRLLRRRDARACARASADSRRSPAAPDRRGRVVLHSLRRLERQDARGAGPQGPAARRAAAEGRRPPVRAPAMTDSRLGSAVHLAIDMQLLFAEPESPWRVPWLPRVLPQVLELARRHPERTVFTRFIPPRASLRTCPARGSDYYRRWQRHDAAEPRRTPARAASSRCSALVPPAHLCDKAVYSAFGNPKLAPWLETQGADTLIVSGGETDVCVLATVMSALDLGYHVVLGDRRAVQRERRNARRPAAALSRALLAADHDGDDRGDPAGVELTAALCRQRRWRPERSPGGTMARYSRSASKEVKSALHRRKKGRSSAAKAARAAR